MSETCPLERPRMRARSTAKLSLKFARRGLLRTILYAAIFAAILVVLGLSELIMNFNGGEVAAAEMKKRDLSCTSFIKDTNDKYDKLDTTRLVDVNEDDLQKFYDAGYEGKVYPLVYYPLFNTGNNYTVFEQRFSLHTDPYSIPGTIGVLVTEESYVEKIFGGLEYEALAGEQKAYGVYITDYFADAYRICHPEQKLTYQDMVGQFTMIPDFKHAYINGIVKTGYKERYRETIGKLTDPSMSEDELKAFAKSDECLALFDELCQYWSIAYSFNADFVECVAASDARDVVPSGLTTFKVAGKTFSFADRYFYSVDSMGPSVSVGDSEAIFSYEAYNKLFGTNYTPRNLGDFVPHEVKLTYYFSCDSDLSDKKYETTLTVIRLMDTPRPAIVSDKVFADLQRVAWSPYGYCFDNAGQAELLFNTAAENGFIPNSSIAGSVVTMTKAVGVFSWFFDLIFTVLCAALLLLMVQFELKSIKDRMKDIGILKALGARDGGLIAVFGFQLLIVGILMVILYIAGSFVFIGLANDVLVLSLSELAKNAAVMNVSFLVLKWKYILQNCILSLAILAVSFLAPMLRLRYIRPTNVIKAKE